MPSLCGTRRLWFISAITSGAIVLGGAAAYMSLKRSKPSKPATTASVEPLPRSVSSVSAAAPQQEKGKEHLLPHSLPSEKTASSTTGAKKEPAREDARVEVQTEKPSELKASAPTQPPGSPALAQQLLSALQQLDLSDGALTDEEVKDLKDQLKQLAEQGTAAIPAIREFLEGKKDIKLEGLQGKDLVNFSSLRTALIDTLQQIGGPEAVDVFAQSLQKTSDPMEIALLTRALAQWAPNEYNDAALTVARDTLTKATSEAPADARSVSPLFEVLQKFGDASVVPDLEKAVSKWNYYATLALAGLPDGAGIPSLIRLSQDPAVSALGSGDIALRVLAQVSMQYPDARSALMDEARSNQIPESAWPNVAATLAGNYIQYGNQIFGATAPSLIWTDEQVQKRLALIDQISAATASATGRRYLDEARDSLVKRLKE